MLLVMGATVTGVWLVMGEYLFRTDWPLYGDIAGHMVAVAWLREYGLHSWTFGWFAGLPLFYFYFPLPAGLGVALAHLFGLGPAMRMLVLIGPLALPVSTLFLARAAGATQGEAAAAGLGTLVFLHLRFLDILGGTFQAAAIGEYSYSIALALGLLYLGAIWRSDPSLTRLAGASVLLAAVALSHLIVLLIVVFASAALLGRRTSNNGRLVVGSWILAFLLSAFWTVPFLVHIPEMADIWWKPFERRTGVPLLVQAAPLAFMSAIGISLASRPIQRMAPFAVLIVAGVLPFALPAPFFPLRGLPVAMLGLAVIASVYAIHVVAAARALRAPIRLALWVAAALFFLILQVLGPSRTAAVAPYLGGDMAAGDKKEWIEMRTALAQLPQGAVLGAGSRPRSGTNSVGFSLFHRSSMAQLPLRDNRRTLNGLLQESARVSQYVREAEWNLGSSDRGLVRRFGEKEPNFGLGVAQAAALGARYIVLVGDAVRLAARGNRQLEILVESNHWAIAEIIGSAVVLSFSEAPNDPCTTESTCRGWFANMSDHEPVLQEVRVIGYWPEDRLEIDGDAVRFRTSTPGLPHIVRLSYFPGWRLLTPGQGPRRFGPNQMLLTPETPEVELSISPGWPIVAGRVLSGVGLLLIAGGVFWRVPMAALD